MQYCVRCDNTRWVCEAHTQRPFLGECTLAVWGGRRAVPGLRQKRYRRARRHSAMPPGFVVKEGSRDLQAARAFAVM